jgi:hypothetical protein
MKVYILIKTFLYESGVNIIGVYDSEQKAIEERQKQQAEEGDYYRGDEILDIIIREIK